MRWRILLPALLGSASLLTASLAASSPGALASPRAASETLYAFNSGLVLSVTQHAGVGAAVRVAPPAGRTGQRWVFGSHNSVRPVSNSGLCLTVVRYRGGTPLDLAKCTGAGSQQFRTRTPSAHTEVFYLESAAQTKYCIASLGDPAATPASGDKVGLTTCAGWSNQAWSTANLAGVTSYVSNFWALQAQHSTSAGSAVTGANLFTGKLDQFWVATSDQGLVELQPVGDIALCAALTGAEANGVSVDLADCASSASQQFMGIELIYNTRNAFYYLTTPDASYCLQAAASGPADLRPVLLGSCHSANLLWQTGLDLSTANSNQFQEIYAGTNTGSDALEFSMRVAGSGGNGSPVELSADDEAPQQVWTDLAPGQARPQSNPDGSITLRPLSDQSLCLSVPDGDYAAGTNLTVQTCDGDVDQEFVKALLGGPTDLVAAGDGEFCVAVPDGIEAGSAVELEPCADENDQTWSEFLDWGDWVGQPLAGTAPVADPGDFLVLSDASSTGGQVGVLPTLGDPGWYTSQDWIYVEIAGGSEIQSVYDPGLCLDASASTAGTQLTAAPCTGGTEQRFTFGSGDGGLLWRLGATSLCVAVSSPSGSAGLPLVLQACSSSAADEAWSGPSSGL